jgi:RNA polymerase sigma factor (sigma-70 family)
MTALNRVWKQAVQEDDAVLLARFVARSDGDAFAELVRRHGPMVLGVCRRVLGNGPDADDAFQAAFIVLARKGSALRNERSVGSWLFGVARFVALRARAKARRRRAHESRAGRVAPIETGTEPDLLATVDEELQRLPARYRAPLIACFLQGQTQEEAARETGCSLSTLRRRLDRGRELLRQRLTRRGAVPALAALAASVDGSPVSAGVIETTTAAVVADVSGGAQPVPATTLAEGVLAMMARTKLKRLIVAVMVVAGSLGGVAAWHLSAAQPEAGRPAEAKAPAKPTDPPPKDKGAKDKDAKPAEDQIKPAERLTIRVRNVLPDEPINGEFDVEASGKVALGLTYGRVKVDGLTLEEAEMAITEHLKNKSIRAPLVSVVRYSPPEGRLLELRVRQLELEVKELRLLVEELRKKP